jgi:DNA-binding response OmpR family regulator
VHSSAAAEGKQIASSGVDLETMSSKTKILIVEDQTSVAMMMVYVLHRAGCEVQGAWNAEKAMRLAQDGDFDLITLDIDLPGTSGFEICSQLKQIPRLRDIPVVFVSGRPHAEDRQRAFELGAVDYIEKPFEATDFIFRIISSAKPKNDFATILAIEKAAA